MDVIFDMGKIKRWSLCPKTMQLSRETIKPKVSCPSMVRFYKRMWTVQLRRSSQSAMRTRFQWCQRKKKVLLQELLLKSGP